MKIDNLQLDRMADGELSLEEQRQLLVDCETGNHWRELALAYVESQAFANALCEFETPSVITNERDVARASRRMVQPIGKKTTQNTRRDQTNWNIVSLAAAVLISLGLGYGIGWLWQDDFTSGTTPAMVVNRTTQQDDAQNPLASTAANQAIKKQDKMRTMPFMVPDPGNHEMRQVELPVVYASDLGPNWEADLSEVDLPAALLQDLQAGGLNVRQTRTMTRVRLPDGRVVVVPIDYFIEHPFQ